MNLLLLPPRCSKTPRGSTALCAAALLLYQLSFPALCWFDEGHLIMGEVARRSMSKSAVQHIEELLSLWEADYPGQSTISRASPWLDKFGCQDGAAFCAALERQDGFQLLRSHHYSSLPWNPQNLVETRFMKSLPHPGTGAAWILELSYQSLKTFIPSLRNKDLNAYGVRMTLILTLRIFIHVYQDAHQPLHMLEVFTRVYPQGTMGGNSVKIVVQGSGGGGGGKSSSSSSLSTNLHLLWDAAGGPHFRLQEHISDELIADEARRLMEDFPPEKLRERLQGKLDGTDIAALSQDTHEVARTHVYSGPEDPRLTSKAPYPLSSEELRQIVAVSREQMALAGYRLGKALESLSTSLPGFLEVISIARDPTLICPKEEWRRGD